MYPSEVKTWVVAHQDDKGFLDFMKLIEKRCEDYRELSLNRGDTEYEKGQFVSLKWACELPKHILNTIDGDT